MHKFQLIYRRNTHFFVEGFFKASVKNYQKKLPMEFPKKLTKFLNNF